jgi:hypothetical protein
MIHPDIGAVASDLLVDNAPMSLEMDDWRKTTELAPYRAATEQPLNRRDGRAVEARACPTWLSVAGLGVGAADAACSVGPTPSLARRGADWTV